MLLLQYETRDEPYVDVTDIGVVLRPLSRIFIIMDLRSNRMRGRDMTGRLGSGRKMVK
jgi:hypothetical protein